MSRRCDECGEPETAEARADRAGPCVRRRRYVPLEHRPDGWRIRGSGQTTARDPHRAPRRAYPDVCPDLVMLGGRDHGAAWLDRAPMSPGGWLAAQCGDRPTHYPGARAAWRAAHRIARMLTGPWPGGAQ